jgi:small subunit ribosomal protein S17
MAETTTPTRGTRKTRTGTVISKMGEKSLVVRVESRKRHPLYGKVMSDHSNFHVHDEANVAGIKDVVTIVETRPVSKLKRWRLIEVVEKRS